MVASGTFIKLNEELWPGCYYARSDASDVARVEDRTFICSLSKDSAGPTNNWEEPYQMRRKLKELFDGSMRGRTMYVLPFSMGPIGSPMSQIGVQLTDSPYVVVNMRIMARIGLPVYEEIDKDYKRVVPCMHSVGAPLAPGQKDVPWPCNKEKYIVHFPETREIWSYGSGYGGNALLGKKCFALRIASNIARDEGWMAEHMLIVGVGESERRKDLCRRGLSQCLRQDQFRHADSADGFRGLESLDRRRRHRLDQAGCERPLRAINPEAGFFGVAPGTSDKTNPNAMATLSQEHHFHQRRADARRRRVVGRHDGRAARRVPGLAGQQVDAGDRAKKPAQRPRIPNAALHRARLAMSHASIRIGKIRTACPSAPFIFGGRRATTMPLVYQAFNWSAGVYIGATMGSETTAAAAGTIGKVRRDPMAMLPFCGYHMGDYFRHWIHMQRVTQRDAAHLSRELVPQRRRRQVHVAGLRREHARAQVDRRPRPRPRPGERDAHRLDAAL